MRGTIFVRNGAVTPGPSRECDITFFVQGRPKSARQSTDSTVAVCRVQSVTVPSSRVSRECRSPGLRSPPFKNVRKNLDVLKVFSGRPRTTLGFSPPLDVREPLTQGIPQSRNSRAEESLDRGLLGLSLQGWSISPQGVLKNRLRNCSGQEFRASKGGEHPRVVLGQPNFPWYF